MRGYLSLALIAVYFAIAFYLEAARLFSEEGQRHRHRAISFYVFGGLTLLVLLILLRVL
jgi:hypothetical protein